MKRKKFILFIQLLLFMSYTSVNATNSQVLITIEASKVGNMYYEVIENDQRIINDINYSIYNSNNDLIYTNKTNNGLLVYNNLPFDHYTIIIKDKSFHVSINSEYLKTQHHLKKLDITSHIYSNTRDVNSIIPLFFLNMISLPFLYCRRYLHD